MFRLENLPTFESPGGALHVVVDTPKGSRNKYRYDAALGLFTLARVLPCGMHFPFDFGSIPGTCAEDGDALDVLVLVEAGSFTGCLLTVRLLGVLRGVQSEGRRRIHNDRLIAVVETPVNTPRERSLRDISPDRLHEIEQFFIGYNRIQGRRFEIQGRSGSRAAQALVHQAARAWHRKVATA